MSSQPSNPLQNQNAAIHGNTLYTFQPNAFQSIDLAANANWTSLAMGVPVNMSSAVVATSSGQDALFIVGGLPTDAAQASYPGFQKYLFGSNQWQALQPETSVTQNRIQHGSAWLQATKSILVYGGFQDNSYRATSQCYTISTEEPYVMRSFPAIAPQVANPIVLSYNASHALMAGGGAGQESIWTFSEADGWARMTSTIPGGVASTSQVQGAIVRSGNGIALELFDMGASPNTVKTISLSNQFAPRGVDLSERDAPAYNASSAPTVRRNGFSLAQASSGLIVVAGGVDKSQTPLAVFNQSANSWQDASAVFGAPATNNLNQIPLGSSSSAAASATTSAAASSTMARSATSRAASATATASAVASSAVAAAASATSSSGPDPSAGSNTTIIIAAVVGTVLGLLALFLLAFLLLCLRRRRRSDALQNRHRFEEKMAGPDASGGAFPQRMPSAQRGPSPFGNNNGALGSKPSISQPRLVPMNGAGDGGFRAERGFGPADAFADLEPPRPIHAAGAGAGGNPLYQHDNNTVENLYPGGAGPAAGPTTAQHNGPSGLGGAAMGAAAGAAVGGGLAAAAVHRNQSKGSRKASSALLQPQPDRRNTAYTETSEYTIDSPVSERHHDSALVPPLKLRTSYSAGPAGRDSVMTDFDYPLRLDHGGARDGPGNGLARSPAAQVGWNPAAHHDTSTMYLGHGGNDGGNGAGSRESTGPATASSQASDASARFAPRPSSSVYIDRASAWQYSQNQHGGSNGTGQPQMSPGMMAAFPPVPDRRELERGAAGKDVGMRSIVSTDFGVEAPQQGQGLGMGTFPQAAVRRAGPGVEARSAGNAMGRGPGGDGQGDMGWLRFEGQ